MSRPARDKLRGWCASAADLPFVRDQQEEQNGVLGGGKVYWSGLLLAANRCRSGIGGCLRAGRLGNGTVLRGCRRKRLPRAACGSKPLYPSLRIRATDAPRSARVNSPEVLSRLLASARLCSHGDLQHHGSVVGLRLVSWSRRSFQWRCQGSRQRWRRC